MRFPLVQVSNSHAVFLSFVGFSVVKLLIAVIIVAGIDNAKRFPRDEI